MSRLIGPWDYLSGRISALRRVLGDDWHNLDS